MGRTLLVTNDFPPTIGGIQSYLRDFVDTLDPASITVFSSTQDAAAAVDYDRRAPYEVIRWPRKVMLPTPAVIRRMAEIIRERGIDTVWFGAAAPLALMAGAARKAGASRIISTTHGHEVGWSMVPGARQVLGRIGRESDVVTYISEYTLRRFRRAFGTHPEFVHLPSGVDIDLFQPLNDAQKARVQAEFGGGPLLVCISRLVPRKGQDQLIRTLPEIRRRHPGTRLVIVGQGSDGRRLLRLAAPLGEAVVFTGKVNLERMISLLAAADIFAMPARTRGRGLDVEGLGIVYLEAQACAIPVIAGDSGGAPETVTPETGIIVGGRDLPALIDAADGLLSDPARRLRMGRAGRRHVEREWTWRQMGQRLQQILDPS